MTIDRTAHLLGKISYAYEKRIDISKINSRFFRRTRDVPL
jgi:hypothetical protein